jgi:hypothetical protein
LLKSNQIDLLILVLISSNSLKIFCCHLTISELISFVIFVSNIFLCSSIISLLFLTNLYTLFTPGIFISNLFSQAKIISGVN